MKHLALALLVIISCNSLLPSSAVAQEDLTPATFRGADRRTFEEEMAARQRRLARENEQRIQARKEQAALDAQQKAEEARRAQEKTALKARQQERAIVARVERLIEKYGKGCIIPIIRIYRSGAATVSNGWMDDSYGSLGEHNFTAETIVEDLRKARLSVDKLEEEVAAFHRKHRAQAKEASKDSITVTQNTIPQQSLSEKAVPQPTGNDANPHWVLFEAYDDFTLYIDPSTLFRNGNAITMLTLFDYKTTQIEDKYSFLSLVEHLRLDCSEQRVDEIYRAIYSDRLGTNKSIWSGYLNNRSFPIAPDTVSAALWEAFCRSETPDPIDRAYKKVTQAEAQRRAKSIEYAVMCAIFIFGPLILAAVWIVKSEIKKTREAQATEEETLHHSALESASISIPKETISGLSVSDDTNAPDNKKRNIIGLIVGVLGFFLASIIAKIIAKALIEAQIGMFVFETGSALIGLWSLSTGKFPLIHKNYQISKKIARSIGITLLSPIIITLMYAIFLLSNGQLQHEAQETVSIFEYIIFLLSIIIAYFIYRTNRTAKTDNTLKGAPS